MRIPRTPSGGQRTGKPEPAARTWRRDDRFEVWVAHIAAPQGSHKQGFGKSVRETNPKTEPYRQAVADAITAKLEEYEDWQALNGACALAATFYMPPLKSDPDRHWVTGPPDLDKVLRATCDGITRSGLWKDDARLAKIDDLRMIHARTMEETGVLLTVREL